MKRIVSAFWVIFFLSFSYAVAKPAPESFADLAEDLLPVVVNISTSQEVEAPQLNFGFPQLPPGHPFEEFFKEFFDRGFPGQPAPGPNGQPQPGPHRSVTALGSGFIVSAQGHIVTNRHVIADADEITVILFDETELAAELLGVDEKTDLALLKVSYDKPLKFAKWGNSSKSRVGDWVVAIGNPFGLGGTVTAGIISARARDINAGPYDDFIQTDASINRGNSGGPMFNIDGEVVGINTAIFSPSGGSVGIGFAVPSDLAKPVIDQLRKYGRTKRGWLGVRIQVVTDELAENLGLKTTTGALVASITEKGPAEAAGLKPGDVILKFNGQDVDHMRQLPRIVAETPVGETANVVVWRNGKLQNFQDKLGELEKAEEDNLIAQDTRTLPKNGKYESDTFLGMELAVLTSDLRGKYEFDQKLDGLIVMGVNRDSEAAQKAIRSGDLIVEVDQKSVRSLGDVRNALKATRSDKKKTVLIRLISSAGNPRFVVLNLDDKKKE